MSRSVLDVVGEGIKEVDLDSINEEYINILRDFFYNICVIDPKRNLTPFNGKYRMVYSCFNNRRESSTLEVHINYDDSMEVIHDFDKISLHARLSNLSSSNQNLFLGVYDYVDDEKSSLSFNKSIIYSDSSAIVTSVNYKNGLNTTGEEKYYYDEKNKQIKTYIRSKTYYSKDTTRRDFISKSYESFKSKKA